MENKSAEEIVRAKWPDTWVEWVAGHEEYWVMTWCRGYTKKLGKGPTKAVAWADAAKRIEKGDGMKHYTSEDIAVLEAELAQARAEIRSLEESLSSHEVSTSYIKKVESERDNYAKDAAWARNHREELERMRAEVDVMNRRIETLIGVTCNRCERGDALLIEPDTGFYTHTLGGNYCSAHKLHSLLNTPQSQAARRKP